MGGGWLSQGGGMLNRCGYCGHRVTTKEQIVEAKQ